MVDVLILVAGAAVGWAACALLTHARFVSKKLALSQAMFDLGFDAGGNRARFDLGFPPAARVPFEKFRRYTRTEDKGLPGYPEVVLAVQMDNEFSVVTPDGLRCGNANWWLLASLNQHEQDHGIRWSIEPSFFRRMYRPAEPPTALFEQSRIDPEKYYKIAEIERAHDPR